VHDFLAALLGTTGLPADARTALGVSTGTVTSVGGYGGPTVSAAQVAAAATAGYGYTPANSVRPTGNVIGGLAGFSVWPGWEGGYVVGSTYAANGAGRLLSGGSPSSYPLPGPVPSGSWKVISYVGYDPTATTYFLIAERVS
jgi:hypothetical protein